MSLIRSVLSTAMTLVIPLGLMVVGGVAALGVSRRERGPQDVRAWSSPTDAASVDDEDRIPPAHDVEMDGPETIVIRGKGGREVANLVYEPDGGSSLGPIGSDSRRFVVELRPPAQADAMRLRMSGVPGGLELRWRTDGSVEIRGIDRPGGDRNAIRIGPDGTIVTESMPGAAESGGAGPGADESAGTLRRVPPVQP